MRDMTNAMLDFCDLLRRQYGIDAGHDRAYEALRATEIAGIGDRARARYAMRLTLCASPDERLRFDRAFEAFFGGTRRPRIRVRRDRLETASAAKGALQRADLQNEDDAASPSTVLAARYSPAAMPQSKPPEIGGANLQHVLRDAGAFIASLRLGPSRRWKARTNGERFDMRRTLRSSLRTAGDPVCIGMLGHPPRNARIVMLVDGSRSMAERAPALLQFAYALCRRSSRVRVFAFSTSLIEITRELRSALPGPIAGLGEAWGGGTRIGAALDAFRRNFGASLTADTVVVIASDGLDNDAGALLHRAMRDIHRRSAGILWLNPHVREPGFEPSARAMRTALPYISALVDARDLHALAAAARRLRR